MKRSECSGRRTKCRRKRREVEGKQDRVESDVEGKEEGRSDLEVEVKGQ